MLWTTQLSGIAETIGADLAVSSGTTVVPSTTAHTMGSWAELVAATSQDTYALTWASRTIRAASATNTGGLLDIGIGASGSERVVLPKLVRGFNPGPLQAWLPLFIPKGSRVAFRTQVADTAGSSIATNATLSYVRGPAWPRATDYGTLTASSGGTSLFTGTLAVNTKSSWTEIISACTYPIRYLHVMIQVPNTATVSAIDGIVDIGVGGSGSERALIGNLLYRALSTEENSSPNAGAFVDIAAGTRLVARWQSSTVNPSQSPRVSLIGFG